MITCKINGKAVDIFEDMKIEIKIDNPMFSENFINEGYSYSFSLPLTPKNKLLLSNSLKKELTIYFKGILFIKSEIISFLETNEGIDLNIFTDAKSIKKSCDETYLEDLNLDEFNICNSGDTPPTKITKWQNYLNDHLLVDHETTSHVFPVIKGIYNDNISAAAEERNDIFTNCGEFANRCAFGSYLLNFPVPTSVSPKNWVTTVLPCPKANYILKKIFDHFNIKIVQNELDDIIEYRQLYIENNFVLDKIEEYSGNNYNVHGTGFNLKNHVPKATLFSFLQMLNELFDAYFIIIGNEVRIFTANNLLQIKPKNVSKFASETFNSDINETTGFSVIYDIPEDDVRYYKTPISGYFPNQIFLEPMKKVDYPNENINNTEISLTALPLMTFINFNGVGFPRTYAEYGLTDDGLPNGSIYGQGQWMSYAFTGRSNFLRSDEYPDNPIQEQIRIGCYRGVKETLQPGFDPDGTYNPILNTTTTHPFTFNYKRSYYWNQYLGDEINIDYIFGESSIMMNGPDNAFDRYKKTKFNFLYGSDSKTKLLYLPLFEIIELMKWKNTKHVIQQKNESFKGFVKNISFTISNDGLSATEVAYVVQSND